MKNTLHKSNTTKTLTAVVLLAGAVAGYSQGTVAMTDYGSEFMFHAFNVSTTVTGNASLLSVTYGGYTETGEYTGDVSTDEPQNPNNNAVYSGPGLTGTGYDSQLLAFPDTGDSLSQLVPTGPVYNYYNNTPGILEAIDQLVTITPTVPGPQSVGGTGATIALAAWNNGGGLYTTLAAAQAAGEPWGISDVVNLTTLGGEGPNDVPYTPPTLGIQSFSLGQTVPEPCITSLGIMGISTLLLCRRK